MQLTTNYKLKKPEANEYYNVEDFNENADIIDEELKKLSDAAGKVEGHAQMHASGGEDPVTSAMIGAVPAVCVYYNTTMNADDLIDPLALIKIGSTSNSELWEAFEKVESHAYVCTHFFSKVGTGVSHVQIAYSYTNAPARFAIRTYNANTLTWTPWRAFAGTDYVLPRDGSAAMAGNLTIEKANPFCDLKDTTLGSETKMLNSADALIFQNFNVAGSSGNRRQINFYNSDAQADIKDAMVLIDVVGGKATSYHMLHTGNMDSLLGNVTKVDMGTYKGTGTRAVNITFPSVPKMVFICADITDSAGTRHVKIVWMNGSDSPHILETISTSFCTASLEGNTLTIEADGAIANYSGMTYTYYAIL